MITNTVFGVAVGLLCLTAVRAAYLVSDPARRRLEQERIERERRDHDAAVEQLPTEPLTPLLIADIEAQPDTLREVLHDMLAMTRSVQRMHSSSIADGPFRFSRFNSFVPFEHRSSHRTAVDALQDLPQRIDDVLNVIAQIAPIGWERTPDVAGRSALIVTTERAARVRDDMRTALSISWSQTLMEPTKSGVLNNLVHE